MNCKISHFMQDLNSLNIEHLEKWFTDETVIWIPPAKEISGKTRILALFRAIFRRYEKIEWRVSEIFALGNDKYFYQTNSLGNMNGKGTYENEICTIIHFSESGKIVYLSDYFKDTRSFN
ncbi:limonene-1,2-epoxide hydrolase [Chryseobacterium ginsenosidimutans]|uniref:nuclear transport factor 2 family protein n=1 Tax=Chryseobacterium ginsenosidimutans TaxID=687846 RepID=UPI00216A3190|nr:nuclear transport factor 2 family protein [Chryseobacterium ginsenosidimutans]MCS3868413.1 limonene-1,2-epoxide hydrolase [Chryseobacterium ginsenosidimutans]